MKFREFLEEGIVNSLESPEFSSFKKEFTNVKDALYKMMGDINVTPNLKTLKREYLSIIKDFEKFNTSSVEHLKPFLFYHPQLSKLRVS